MAGIAISYRRDDTGWITGRIFDRLKEHYESSAKSGRRGKPLVFMDYDSTPVGVDFRSYIQGVLDNCDVVLAIIGPRWAGNDERGEPRFSSENDWVRIEIETALKKNIPVVPVLIDRTPMPRADILPERLRDLAYRQAATVDTQIDFNSHVERLIREIDRILGIEMPRIAPPAAARRTFGRWPQLASKGPYALVAISLCVIAAGLLGIFPGQRKSADPAYTNYRSPELGVTVVYPNNIFTLDVKEEKARKLTLWDGDGHPTITLQRTALPGHKNPKLGRDAEVAELTKMNFILTYLAPEKEENWTNWYVLSGINHGTEFYFRRWYTEDSVVSIEFMYPKELAPLFDKVIPKMTHEFVFTSTTPKT